ncbi:3-isopropylmalate dehydratase small subunit [Candidatus Sororendozoicomonas aggregata]|uniref:3-isopropylmalate dehydratase small subunit n=1 Tax=Candidatus Sororendozoicomonas aggregata TaxID=3073239 RepID=UPI002ED237F3
MQAFTIHEGMVAPLNRANVDTDMIIPKQFLKSIKRTGFGPNLFDEVRYLDEGQPGQACSTRPINPDFVLNKPRYKGVSILLARQNFGCGSSREHAPWALLDFGFRCVIAPSFADIFYNNCFKNGILPVTLPEPVIDQLFQEEADSESPYRLTVDLEKGVVMTPDGNIHDFTVDAFRKHCMLHGLDDIGITLQEADAIKAFERQYQKKNPWLFREQRFDNNTTGDNDA